MFVDILRSAGVRCRAATAVAVATVIAVGLAGCGTQFAAGDRDAAATPVTSADPTLATMVPEAIRTDGAIVVGIESTFPPAEFIDPDSKALVGFDVDLFHAVAAKLDLRAEFEPASFGDIIPGVTQTRAYEIGVSSFTITAERKSRALMVSYFKAGTLWATAAGNPAGVIVDDACGKRIAVPANTAQAADVAARSKRCTDAQKPAIAIEAYPDVPAAADAVRAGSQDAMVADSVAGGYAVRRSDAALAPLGEVYDAAPYGYVVATDQQAFADAVRDALKALIAEGTYLAILERWGVQGGALADPAVNP